MNTTPLHDMSPMPFGKHRGTPLCLVPVSYFNWLRQQDGFATTHPALAAWLAAQTPAQGVRWVKRNQEDPDYKPKKTRF
jgi:uncharacterized protein (DUF3820 family)